MLEKYETITPEIFGVKPNNAKLPSRLTILKGYRAPIHSQSGGGFPEFRNWVSRTLETNDPVTIGESITLLSLKSDFYEEQCDSPTYGQDSRTRDRINEGLRELQDKLEAIVLD